MKEDPRWGARAGAKANAAHWAGWASDGAIASVATARDVWGGDREQLHSTVQALSPSWQQFVDGENGAELMAALMTSAVQAEDRPAPTHR